MGEKEIDGLKEEGKTIGRDDELEEFSLLLDEVKSGKGNTAFVSGEPGVGKSHLVDEIKAMARDRDFDVLQGVCSETASQPYLPFQQIWMDSEKESLDSLSFTVGEDDPLKEREDVKTYRQYRGVAFYETTEQLREAVTEDAHLIIIENVHLAEKATLNLFHYLSDRLQDAPILFLATYQPGEAVSGSSFTDIKQQMSRKNLFTEIELDPLTFEETWDLVTNITGLDEIPADFVEILYEKTEGNPLFIKETIHQMLESNVISLDEGEFPKKESEFSFAGLVRDVVERRVFRMDDSAREMLQLGSVIGKEIPFPLLSSASGLDEFELLDEVDKLIKARLWTEDPIEDKFLFSHEVIADTIYKGMGKWLEKKRLHLKVAEAIEDVYEAELEERYPQLAEHYEKAEKYHAALDYYLKGARKAKSVYANEDAIKMYEKAKELTTWLDDVEEMEILEEMSDAYRLDGDYEKSQDYLYQALGIASNFREEQKIYLDIINTWQEHGEFERALDLVEKRLPLENENTLEKGQLLGKKGWSLMQMGSYEEAVEAFEKEKEVAEDVGDEKQLAQAYHDIGSVALMRRKHDKALENLEEAKKIRERIGDQMGLSKTLSNLSGVFAYIGALYKALEKYERCLEIYEDMGAEVHIGGIHNNIGLIYQKKGDHDKALEHLRRGYDISEKMDNEFIMCHASVNIGEVYFDKEEFDEALGYLEEGLKLSKKTGHLDKTIEAERVWTQLELERGNVDRAEDHVKSLIEATSDRDVERDKALIEYLKGGVLREKGDLESSMEHFEKAVKLFGEIESMDIEAMCMYDFGLLCEEKGEAERAERFFEEAKNYFEDRGMELWKEKCMEHL
ncbi:MAG: BREX system ATP-binding domain-containing protein [Candidatus Thermoplasmatota archaeon]